MNNKKKRAVVACVVLLIAASAFGCSNKKDGSNSSSGSQTTTVNPNLLNQPFTFSIEETDSNDSNLDSEDPTSDVSGNETSATDNNTNENSNSSTENTGDIDSPDPTAENLTEYVPVTETDGEPVTDSNGEQVTTVITVTTDSLDPTIPNDPESTTPAPPQENKSNYKKGKIYWFNLSKEDDFEFNGDFISVKFKIKENTADGVYDLKITNPDFSNYDGVTLKPNKLEHGKIFVGQEGYAQNDFNDSDGFAIYTDNASGKQGDEIVLNFRMNKNPGMCAMVFEFQYDENAFKLIECVPSGEFADISNN